MAERIAVVIPTTGRSSLQQALISVSEQNVKLAAVLVVDDSISQEVKIPLIKDHIILKTGGEKGPSFSRNLGMAHAKAEWIAFLDDDDYWLPEHIEKLLEFCKTNDLDAAYSSAIVSGKIRPQKIIKPKTSPLISLYEKPTWRPTKYYLPTPGLMISRTIAARLAFNTNLFEREDLWFAHKIFENQFKLGQSRNASLVVNQDSKRSINRTTLENDLNWSERLELVGTQARDFFLQGIAFRNAIVRKDWRAVKIIAKMYPRKSLLFWIISKL